MKHTFKRITAFTLTLIIFGAAASCTEKTKSHHNSGNSADETVTVQIAVGNYISPAIETAMKEFNEQDNGYRLETVYYDSDSTGTNNSLQTADLKLQMDIIQGESIDLVMDSAFTEKNLYDILSQKGAFADVYTFLDTDTEMQRSELNEHILSLHETDGKLYQIPLFYEARTLISPTAYVGTKENQTIAEITAHWENMPENSVFLWDMSAENIYYEFIQSSLGTYIDYNSATCSFDSQSFVSLLNFCGEIQKQKTAQDIEQREFLRSRSIYGLYQFHELLNEIPNDTYTLVGYPSEDNNGGFVDTIGERWSICMKSTPEEQAGAWTFLRYLLSEEFQYSHDKLMSKAMDSGIPYEYGFPMNLAAFERKVQEQLTQKDDANFGIKRYQDSQIGWLTQAEYEILTRFLDRLSKMRLPIDDSIQAIITEDTDRFFAGECTAEAAAKAIQERVSICLAEQSST